MARAVWMTSVVVLALAAGGCDVKATIAASEDPTGVLDAPCRGCLLDVPRNPDAKPLPLLVVLHGDKEEAAAARERWRDGALERGWAVLALECPGEQGCDEANRWYTWGGAPSWVEAQITEVARTTPIDRARTVLAGWSGGASYIGMNAPAWKGFAGIVIHGGGQPPLRDSAGCPTSDTPWYFLVGDKNVFHGAAKRLHTYLKSCGRNVTWDLLPGADHAREDAALDDAKRAQIFDWISDPRPTRV